MVKEVKIALSMIEDDPDYEADARRGSRVGNSVVGSLLSLLHGVPRQYGESAVTEALRVLDRRRKEQKV